MSRSAANSISVSNPKLPDVCAAFRWIPSTGPLLRFSGNFDLAGANTHIQGAAGLPGYYALSYSNEASDRGTMLVTISLENAQYFFPTWMWPSSEVMFSSFIANLAAEKASAIADHFCDQTAVAVGFGGNGSAACSAVEGVHQVLNAVYQMLAYVGQDVMSAEVPAPTNGRRTSSTSWRLLTATSTS